MCLTSLVLSLQEIITNLLLEDNDLLSYVYTLDPNLKMNIYTCWVIVTFKDLNHFLQANKSFDKPKPKRM